MNNSNEKTVFETTVSLPVIGPLIHMGVLGFLALFACMPLLTNSTFDVLSRFVAVIVVICIYAIIISPVGINYLRLKKIKWTVTDQKLIIVRGKLFNSLVYHLSPDQIYQATYTQDFIAKLFNFGTVTVQKSIGVGAYETQIRLKNPDGCVQAINQLVKNYKASMLLNNSRNYISDAETSSINELEKLIKLKESGKISEEDFQLFKAKLSR